MLKSLTTSLMITLAAGQATALSCLPPDVARSYTWAAESDDIYSVLLGRFTFDEALLPSGAPDFNGLQRPDPARIPAEFQGVSLNHQGFSQPVNRQVFIQPICAGPWCGSMQSGGEVLAFVKWDREGFILEVGPCFGNVFPDPTLEMRQRVVRCHQGGPCIEQPLR